MEQKYYRGFYIINGKWHCYIANKSFHKAMHAVQNANALAIRELYVSFQKEWKLKEDTVEQHKWSGQSHSFAYDPERKQYFYIFGGGFEPVETQIIWGRALYPL